MAEYNQLLFAKQPKWVQEEIKGLIRLINKLTKEKEILLQKHPESDTIIRFDYPEKMYVPNGTRVEFKVPGVEVQVHTDLEGRVRISFEDGVIAPSGRNSIYILPNKNPKGY